MLFTEEVCTKLEGIFACASFLWRCFRLRIVRETVVADDPGAFVLFIQNREFDLMEDIAQDAGL
jgi:hypothetical protein